MNALRLLPLVLTVALLVAAPGCGKKGPPLAPLRPVPAAIDALTARRLGDRVHLAFTVPSKNQDGTGPADLARIEVYGLTIDPAGRQPNEREFLARATHVAVLEIQPPPDEEAPAGGAPTDARPPQGATVSVDETLSPEVRTPVRFEPRTAARAAAVAAVVPFDPPAGSDGLVRTYVARGFTRGGRASPHSPQVTVALRPVPPAPTGLEVTYTETTFTLRWNPDPPDAWRPLWFLFGFTRGFNLYETPADPARPSPIAPLNATLQAEPTFDTPLAAFGAARCFTVRVAEGFGTRIVASEPAPAVCVTPIDTFAPEAPTGLAAVAEAGAISLIWNGGAEADLGGYLILRAEAPSGTLRAITPSAIRETTWRDISVRPGVRYVYAVVAVDSADPPNRSVPSARVEETAR